MGPGGERMPDYERLMRRWFEEVWNRQRAEVIEELMAPDAVGYGLGDAAEGLHGREAFQALHQRFCGAFPDLKVELEDVIVQGDRCAARVLVTGTHRGDHLGFRATGRPVRFPGLVFVRWKDGQLVEGWNQFDFAGMMAQLQPPQAAQSSDD
jgi:steroid delta-isomerase-like uncharacterized protein